MSKGVCLRSALIAGVSFVSLNAVAATAIAADPPDTPASAPAATDQPATTPAAAAPETGADGVPEIIVVAQAHQTRLQKVPVAVSVFTGASRDRVGIDTVQEVTNFAPGFVYSPTTTHAYLRGVGRQ